MIAIIFGPDGNFVVEQILYIFRPLSKLMIPKNDQFMTKQAFP